MKYLRENDFDRDDVQAIETEAHRKDPAENI